MGERPHPWGAGVRQGKVCARERGNVVTRERVGGPVTRERPGSVGQRRRRGGGVEEARGLVEMRTMRSTEGWPVRGNGSPRVPGREP